MFHTHCTSCLLVYIMLPHQCFLSMFTFMSFIFASSLLSNCMITIKSSCHILHLYPTIHSCGLSCVFVAHSRSVVTIQLSVKVKWSRYRPGVTQRVGRGIALLFHDRGTRRGWVVSSTPLPHFTPRKDPVPILQEAGWAPGPVWKGRKPRPHRDSIPDRPARSQSLYWISYPAHTELYVLITLQLGLTPPPACWCRGICRFYRHSKQ